MTSVAAFGGSAGGGMGGSDDEGDYDKRMRVVTDFVGSSSSDDPDDEETDEEGETTESKVERRNSDLRKLTLDHDLPPNLHKRKLTIKIKYGGKSLSTVSLEEMGKKSAVRPVTVKKRRLSSTGTLSPRITRASSAPIPALPPHLAEDSDQDAYVDIIGVSDEDEEIVQNQNQNLQIVEVGNKEKKKNKKKKKKNMRSKKRSKK